MLRYACWAVKLKVGPVIPGAAPNDTGARNRVTAITSVRNSCDLNVAFFMFIGLIAALLVAGVSKGAAGSGWLPSWDDAAADMDLGHESAEVLSVVGQV